jgi:hypothetical protein
VAVGSSAQTRELAKAPRRSFEASVAISEGILKGKKYAPLREALESSQSGGPLPQQMFFDTQMVPLKVAELCSVTSALGKLSGALFLARGILGPLLLASFQVTTSFLCWVLIWLLLVTGVSEALKWAIIRRIGKRAFVPGLDPRVFACSLELRSGEACCLGQEVVLTG